MSKPPAAPLSIEDSLMDTPAISWIVENGKNIGYGLAIAVLLMILVYRIFASQASQSERDFMQVTKSLVELNDPAKKDAALQELNRILEKHPELQASYDGVIAQELLNQGDLTAATPFIERTFKRVQGETSPAYLQFSQTSVTLAQDKLTEALTQAYALQVDMLKEINNQPPAFGGTLYAFNLIRIALIEKELKNKDGEQKALAELKEIVKGTHRIKLNSLETQRVMLHLNGKTSFLD